MWFALADDNIICESSLDIWLEYKIITNGKESYETLWDDMVQTAEGRELQEGFQITLSCHTYINHWHLS